jgi:hypothetical protein
MYTDKDFNSKKELKEALEKSVTVRVYQPNDMFGITERISRGKHTVSLEGPHYPKPHKWYAQAEVVDGIVMKVR